MPAPTSRIIRPREPDPFGGEREQYKTWKSQMMRYLASSPDTPESQRITILLSNVRGPKVDQWINGYSARHFNMARQWDVSLGQVWADLDQTYTDHVA